MIRRVVNKKTEIAIKFFLVKKFLLYKLLNMNGF